MNWTDGPLVPGIFVERLHRFGARVKVRGRVEYCHVTNSGRLRELLYPGAQVSLVDHLKKIKTQNLAFRTPRKTRFAVRLAYYRKRWVCVEANIAPKLLHEAWKKGLLPDLKNYDRLKAEAALDARTRFDFLALNSRTGEKAWIEVKCATLVDEGGTGWFPDAPSKRACKHLRELTGLSRRPNTKCLVYFILQNPLGKAVRPKDDTDPLFGKMLRRASRRGVAVRALRARVGEKGARLENDVPVLL